MRYFLELSYDGTNYAGWQKQPNVRTIQGEIEKALSMSAGISIEVIGCGRTDKGVHAKNFVCHFDTTEPISEFSNQIYKLNGILSPDIVCHRVYDVPEDLHARYDAVQRSYEYNIHMSPNPFKRQYSTFFPLARDFNAGALDQVATLIIETSDFTSFCKSNTDVKTMKCTILESSWQFPEKDVMIYRITANRFLRGMVRLIVGTSLNVSLGRISVREVAEHISRGTRSHYMSSAPARGLFLCDVKYPHSKQQHSKEHTMETLP